MLPSEELRHELWRDGVALDQPRQETLAEGENGDLFLMVPFLAPVGPISGAFFGY